MFALKEHLRKRLRRVYNIFSASKIQKVLWEAYIKKLLRSKSFIRYFLAYTDKVERKSVTILVLYVLKVQCTFCDGYDKLAGFLVFHVSRFHNCADRSFSLFLLFMLYVPRFNLVFQSSHFIICHSVLPCLSILFHVLIFFYSRRRATHGSVWNS